MIAIDTNILVRYLVSDDAGQADAARRLFENQLSAETPGFVSVASVVELEWVLRSGYGFAPGEIGTAIVGLIDTPNLIFESEAALRRAAGGGAGGFVDRLIHFVGAEFGCERTLTFDRRFAGLDGVELLSA